MVLTLFKRKILIGKNKNPKTCSTKIQDELSKIVSYKEITDLIGKEVLYWIKDDHDNGYASWSKILGVSPNGKFVRLTDLDDDMDVPPYYRNIEAIEIVDILS